MAVHALLFAVLDADLEEQRLDRTVEPDADSRRRVAEVGPGSWLGAADERMGSRLARQRYERRQQGADDDRSAPQSAKREPLDDELRGLSL